MGEDLMKHDQEKPEDLMKHIQEKTEDLMKHDQEKTEDLMKHDQERTEDLMKPGLRAGRIFDETRLAGEKQEGIDETRARGGWHQN